MVADERDQQPAVRRRVARVQRRLGQQAAQERRQGVTIGRREGGDAACDAICADIYARHGQDRQAGRPRQDRIA